MKLAQLALRLVLAAASPTIHACGTVPPDGQPVPTQNPSPPKRPSPADYNKQCEGVAQRLSGRVSCDIAARPDYVQRDSTEASHYIPPSEKNLSRLIASKDCQVECSWWTESQAGGFDQRHCRYLVEVRRDNSIVCVTEDPDHDSEARAVCRSKADSCPEDNFK